MSTCVIVNPKARQGGRLEAVRELVDGWPEARLVVTERPGHGTELARAAAEDGYTTVVAAGGDGTLNEVLQGLDGYLDRVRLGLLPLGTGNDFARSAGIARGLEQAFDQLRTAEPRPVDVARYRCGDRRGLFLNLAAGGFSGEVDERLTSELKSFWGPLAYLRAALETLPDLSPYRLRLEIDGEQEELEALNAVVANGRFVAAGLPMAPRAELDDGWLDVVIIRAAPVAVLAALAPRVIAGTHLDGEVEGVYFRRVRKLRLEATPSMPFNVDGELAGSGTFEVEVLAGGLQFLWPG